MSVLGSDTNTDEVVRRVIDPRLLRPEEAALALGISRSKVYQLMAARRLGSVLVGGSRRVPMEAIDEFVSRLRHEAAG